MNQERIAELRAMVDRYHSSHGDDCTPLILSCRKFYELLDALEQAQAERDVLRAAGWAVIADHPLQRQLTRAALRGQLAAGQLFAALHTTPEGQVTLRLEAGE